MIESCLLEWKTFSCKHRFRVPSNFNIDESFHNEDSTVEKEKYKLSLETCDIIEEDCYIEICDCLWEKCQILVLDAEAKRLLLYSNNEVVNLHLDDLKDLMDNRTRSLAVGFTGYYCNEWLAKKVMYTELKNFVSSQFVKNIRYYFHHQSN